MTKPRSSRAMSGPSQSVRGEAPMKTNSQFAATSSSVPAARSASVIASRCSPPRPATTSVCSRTSTLPAARMRSTRYCDIVASSEPDRTSSTTRRAKRAKFSTAWPAEFAAPTMYTSSFSQARASLASAP